MVEIIRRGLSESCYIHMTISSSDGLILDNIPDVVEEVLTDEIQVENRIGDTITIDFGDRVWTRRPWMIIDHVFTRYAVEAMSLEDRDSEEAYEEAMEIIGGKIRASGEMSLAELLVEVRLASDISEEEFEDVWSQHIIRDDSLNDMFPKVERINERNYIFRGQSGDIDSVEFGGAMEQFKDDFRVADSVLACRPL